MMQTLRPYQERTIAAILQAREAGLTRLLVQAATGTGKTSSFSSLPTRLAPWLDTFPANSRRILVIAHREELIAQAVTRLRSFNPGAMVDIEQADQHSSRYSDITVASIQTLTARKCTRLKRLVAREPFRLVVYDECHHISSPSARTALVHLGFLPPADASDKESFDAPSYDDVKEMASALAGWDAVAPKDRLLVGFTATPNRSDGVGLGAVFQSIVDTYPIRQAIDDGWLVPIVPWVVETATDLDTVRINHGDFNQKDLASAVNTPKRNQLAVAGWHEHALHRPTIAFTVDVAHAYALADAFSASGIKAAAVSGETPKEERAATLAAFTRGDVLVLCNCQVFTEGTDLPLASCILMAKPTKSPTLYTQCVGRGLRTYPGKADCVILDVVDVARRHSLQQAPVLYGLPPNLNAKGKTLKSVAEDLEAFLEKYPGFNVEGAGRLSLAELQAKATQIDIWTVPTAGAFGAGRTLNWIKIGQDSYRVQYPWADGTEALTVTKDMLGHFDVSLTLRTRLGAARQRTIAAQVETAETAAGLAEAFVQAERRSVTKLVDRDAPWRKRPANDKQLGLMRVLHIPIKPGITAGEASTQIDIAKAKQGR